MNPEGFSRLEYTCIFILDLETEKWRDEVLLFIAHLVIFCFSSSNRLRKSLLDCLN